MWKLKKYGTNNKNQRSKNILPQTITESLKKRDFLFSLIFFAYDLQTHLSVPQGERYTTDP